MPISFSQFFIRRLSSHVNFASALISVKKKEHPPLVRIHAYCLMPTHTHFLLEQLLSNGIYLFMKNIQSGYSQFFNKRHNRQGPLWQNRFGSKVISDENDFNRVRAYIHNNPVKDLGIADPALWPYSSANTCTLPGSVQVCYNPECF
jgi:putative transposase